MLRPNGVIYREDCLNAGDINGRQMGCKLDAKWHILAVIESDLSLAIRA